MLLLHKSICIALWLGVLAAGLFSNPSQRGKLPYLVSLLEFCFTIP